MKNIVYKKIDQDDILEIISEYFIELHNTRCSKGNIFGIPGKDLRFIGVFGDNNEVYKCDLSDIDNKIDYNGDHAYINKHPELIVKPTDDINDL